MDGCLSLVLIPALALLLPLNRLSLLMEIIQMLLHVGVGRPSWLALIFYLQLAIKMRVNMLRVNYFAILSGFWDRVDRDGVNGPVIASVLAEF